MGLETRPLVGSDGTAHLVTRTRSFWRAFDDPDRPLGATGLLVTDCGVLLRQIPSTGTRRCTFCHASPQPGGPPTGS